MSDISHITLPDSNTYNLVDATVPHTSETAASGGTALSLVTTGEKYIWNSSSALSGLSDVAITSLTNDEILQYNSTSGKWENKDAKADRVPLPADYDATSTYAVGDFCTYNGDAYVCVTTISTPEAWDSSHWILDSQQDYLHSINPSGIGSFSLNRRNGTTIGILSFAAGRNGTASGDYSHAEGDGANATGMSSHAEGISTTASREGAHAEGVSTTSSGISTHAEGRNTTAHGNFSHAEGNNTTSYGEGSHAEGYYTKTAHRSQHVFGEYNVLDPATSYSYQRGNYVEIVGNGTADDARSNARTLDWSGNEVLAGNLKINSTQDVATQVSLTQAEYDALVAAGTVDLVSTIYFITDASAPACSALEVTYSNTSSGLSATNVQCAIDEVYGVFGTLDGVITGSPSASKTLTGFSETDGIVTATFGDISITKSQISDFPSTMTPSSHTHGSITNAGAITGTTALASGDGIIFADSSDSSKLKRSSITIGSATTTFLRNDGTWATPNYPTKTSELTNDSIRAWTSLGSYYSLTANGTWTVSNISSYKELLFYISAYDARARKTMVIPIATFNSDGLFFDFSLSQRSYFALTKNSNTQLKISDGAFNDTQMRLYGFGR